ncbi:TlpA family protein disulfide reductase [Roseobacteraceae bacterium S113]
MKVIPRVLSLALLYLCMAASANATDVATARAALEGSMEKLRFHETPKAVAFVRFEDIDGAPLSLAAYQGKLTIVNFWATWCAPCRREMPMLAALQEEFGGETFDVVTIATGRNPPHMMHRFFDRIDVENLPLHRDPDQAVAQAMGVTGLPTTIVLDAQGREIARMTGEAEWDSESAKAVVRALLPSS